LLEPERCGSPFLFDRVKETSVGTGSTTGNGELGEAGFDLSLIGFDEFELGELLVGRSRLGRVDGRDDAITHAAPPLGVKIALVHEAASARSALL
jgi:hypothetical protein